MKLIKAKEMQEIDRRVTEEYGIASIVLMENAGIKTAEMAGKMLNNVAGKKIVILAGRGNNGGDGLVAARHLHNQGAKPVVFMMGKEDQLSTDSMINYNILHKMNGRLCPLMNEQDREHLLLELLDADLLVDAIYGIGFRGSLSPFETEIIKLVNKSRLPVLAVDIPSGVEADSGKVAGEAVNAAATITFALPKPGLVLEPGKDYAGKLNIADISIPPALLQEKKFKTSLITDTLAYELIKPRHPDSHKGTFGHALLIGGSTGLSGAIILASLAAIRSGAGLVTAALPESLVSLFDSSLLEVMSFPLGQTGQGAIALEALPAIENILGTSSVCAIGPGMSRYNEGRAIVHFVLERAGIPIVIDADGLNALGSDPSVLKGRQIPIVLTPHPGEMARLTGRTIEEIQADRINYAAHYAQEWGTTIVLKGNKTIVAAPTGEIYINISGNPGMATAGSGDVLCGIITGLISQGLKPAKAAALGVYIHGLSGDYAAGVKGETGLIASDLIESLPYIQARFEEKRKSMDID